MRALIISSMLVLCAPPAAAQRRLPGIETGGQLDRATVLRHRGDEAGARALVWAVLEREPESFEAHSFLGHQYFRGRWRLPEEVAYLRRAAVPAEAAVAVEAGKPAVGTPAGAAVDGALSAVDPAVAEARRKQAEADAARLLRRLCRRDDRAAAAARDALVALADREDRPEWQERAVRDFWRSRLAWREAERAVAVGTLTLRLQNVRLLGFDTVPVSFGNGTGRIMLPRTESISFGSTVAVPLGFGR